MKQIELKKIIINNTEETKFSNGALFIYDEGFKISWEIQLMNVTNSSLYRSAFNESQNVELKLVTNNDKKHEGRVIVKSIRTISLGVNLHLYGIGPLIGYFD